MKAFVIEQPGKYSFREIKEPLPEAGEVLIRVSGLGLCGSDLTIWKGLNPMVSYPRIIGHEVRGIIENTGSNVPERVKSGIHVTLVPYTNCHECSACRRGRANACEYNQTLGVQRDGAACEYITAPWEKLIFAGTLTPDELVMVEPLSVGFHAVRRGRVSEHDTVAVFGCGMVGLGAIAGAASETSRVIAVDITDEKLMLANRIGATFIVNSTKENLHEKLYGLTNGLGPDVIIEAVGLPQTYVQAIEEVSFTGRVVYIGYAKEKITYETRKFVMKELDIVGSRNAEKEDFDNVISVLESGKLPVDGLVTKKFPFEKAGEALKYWSENYQKVTKIVIEMN